jgi:hypothetical protein
LAIQVAVKASKTTVKPGQLVRYTLTLTPQDANPWADVNLEVTLNPLLTPANIKPATGNGVTVLSYTNLQRPAAGVHSYKVKGSGALAVTFEARLSKQAPAGPLPIAFTASVSNTLVASLDVSAFGLGPPQKSSQSHTRTILPFQFPRPTAHRP